MQLTAQLINKRLHTTVTPTNASVLGKKIDKKLTGTLASLSLFLSACQPAQNNKPAQENPTPSSSQPSQAAASSTTRTLDEAITSTDRRGNHGISKDTVATVNSTDNIAKRLEISYARNAAYKNDECPKLVEFESVNQTITREGEQLPSDYCEYFVFLNQGDTLSVHTSDAMHAKLISPIWFDFDNGSFTANKFDKYTIRLSYNGVRYHPVNFRYDVVLVKSGVKSSQ